MSEVKECMKSTSIFVATFVKGEKNYTGDKWGYQGCVIYTLEWMVQVSKELGMICKPTNWQHPSHQTWVLITYPENEENIPELSIGASLHLKNELNFYKEKIARLERHPYIKFGLKVNKAIQKIRSLKRYLYRNLD